MIEWLAGTLVATSALILLVFALREPVRRRFGPHVAYALWMLPASRMALPSLTETIERSAAPTASGLTLSSSPSAGAELHEAGLIDQFGGWPELLIAIWLAGAAVMLARGLLVYHSQRSAILAGSVQIARLGSIRIVRSECVAGPLALGIADRVIALPFDFDQRFSECERRLALDHELAHHRSGDLVANTIAFVLLCLQWFNPLAWAAHAAFRFDQEAACDARVLDNADVADRRSYGMAIAKAASGRTLLFAGALDRPSTLSRRLTIMTQPTSQRNRRWGFFLLGGGLLLGLPFTATSAVQYVDARPAAPAPATPPMPVAGARVMLPLATVPAGAIPASAPLVNANGPVTLPEGVTLGKGDVAFFENDQIIMNGQAKRLEDLTPAERARLRSEIAKSQRDLARERAELPARLAEARRELERIKSGDVVREHQEAIRDLKRDLAEIDREAVELRAGGQNPEKLKAEILQSLRDTEGVNIDKEIQEALTDLDPDKIVAELRNAEAQMVRITNRLNQLDLR